MTQLKKLPDLEKVKRTVERLRASNQELEAVTLALDELIAIVEADIRHSPLMAYRLVTRSLCDSSAYLKRSGSRVPKEEASGSPTHRISIDGLSRRTANLICFDKFSSSRKRIFTNALLLLSLSF